jgi:hypothetical protein
MLKRARAAESDREVAVRALEEIREHGRLKKLDPKLPLWWCEACDVQYGEAIKRGEFCHLNACLTVIASRALAALRAAPAGEMVRREDVARWLALQSKRMDSIASELASAGDERQERAAYASGALLSASVQLRDGSWLRDLAALEAKP